MSISPIMNDIQAVLGWESFEDIEQPPVTEPTAKSALEGILPILVDAQYRDSASRHIKQKCKL